MKKIFALAVVLLAIGMTVAPLAQAQTAAQQRELEQIAKRSVNGLSPQDRKRTVEIMTDVFVAQGIPRQQAAALAEQNADSMFSTDVGGMTPEQQRQFAEQNQAIDAFEQMQKPQPPNNRWPPAQTFARYGRTIQKPAVTFNGEYEQNGEELKITIRSPGYYQFKGFTKVEITAICRVFEAEFGSTYPVGTYNDGKNWRDDVIDGRAAHGIEKSDPKHKNTAAMLYWIELDIQPQNSGDQILGLIIVIRPASGRPGGAA